MSCFNKTKKFGFTLAEVLITLTIIGVIAAMTVPNLLTKYERAQWKSQFLQGYSKLQQAGKLYLRDNNDFYPNGLSNWNIVEIAPYIKGTKCTNAICNKKCGTNTQYKTLIGEQGIWRNGGYCYTLDNGASLYVNKWLGELSLIYYDINSAEKGPNRMGYDLFLFAFTTANTIKLDGYGYNVTQLSEASIQNNCNFTSTSSRNGITCAHYALKDPNWFKNLP